MNCQNFESIVNELARQQIMEANVRDLGLRHSEECEVCAVRLADECALTQRLRALASEMTGVEAPAMIEDELLAAFRKNKFTQPRPSANYAWRYWATAAAAVLLIVIGIGAMSMRSRWSPVALDSIPLSQPQIAAHTNKVSEPPVSIDQPKPAPLKEAGTISANQNTRRHKNSLFARPGLVADNNSNDSSVAANYGANEIATDFMPVGYTTPMNLQDGGQVMRVELPRSTLAGFGLPVNMERVNERVKADVLVGPDGQARAIRFVQ
jgi:hypothetical protein